MLRRGKKRRRGSATVEMAVVTPLLLTILFGIIEFGWVFSVRQAMIHAAREGARTAALPGSTDGQVYERVSEYLSPMGLSTYSVTLDRATAQHPVEEVRVQIPYADVSLVGGFFGGSHNDIGATCTMRKEGMN